MDQRKETKVCTKCKVEKSFNEFTALKYGKYGYQCECKLCHNDRIKLYRKTKNGLIQRIYLLQRKACRERDHKYPLYNLKMLRVWCLSQLKFHELYDNWVDSGYNTNLVPSCDRLDNKKTYMFDNIQIVTWQENKNHCYEDMRNGIIANLKPSIPIIQISINNKIISRFRSSIEAERFMDLNSNKISYIIKTRQSEKIIKGFKWMVAYESVQGI